MKDLIPRLSLYDCVCSKLRFYPRQKLKTGSVKAFSRRTIFPSIFSKMQIGFRAFAEASKVFFAREITGSGRVILPLNENRSLIAGLK